MAVAMQEGAMQAFSHLNRQFHAVLFEASDNPVLVREIEHVGSIYPRTHAIFVMFPQRTQSAMREHAVIIRCLERRDAAAAKRAYLAHMAAGYRMLLKYRGETTGQTWPAGTNDPAVVPGGMTMSSVRRVAVIEDALCTACPVCIRECPTEAIWREVIGKKHVIHVDASKCLDCTICFTRCPQHAISMQPRNDSLQFGLDWTKADAAEVKRICHVAHMHEEQVICFCRQTQAREVAAAILLGHDTPESRSRHGYPHRLWRAVHHRGAEAAEGRRYRRRQGTGVAVVRQLHHHLGHSTGSTQEIS